MKSLAPAAEQIIEALRRNEVDAVIGEHQVSYVQIKDIEDRLRRSEQRYRLAERAASVGSWELKSESNTLEWSAYGESFFKRYGFEDIPRTVPELLALIHPNDRDKVAKAYQRCREENKEFCVRHRLLIPDGTFRWFKVIGNLVCDGNGGRIAGIVQDITDEIDAQKREHNLVCQLKRDRDILNTVMDNTATHIAYLDTQFNCLFVNGRYAAKANLPTTELVGRNHFDLFPAAGDATLFAEVLSSGKPVSRTTQIHDPVTGAVNYWNWTLTPILGPKDTIDALVYSAVDVTEARRTEEKIRLLNAHLLRHASEMQEANKELEAFSYSVSHDLRAPLRSINGFCQLIVEDYADKLGPEGQHYFERIQSATKQMDTLIDDILKLSRTNRAEVKREQVNLSQIVAQIKERLAGLDPSRTVTVSIQEDIIAVGDPTMMHIMLTNILENAWKFSKTTKKPKISFGTTTKNGEQVYFVKDNGVGFDMAYGSKIFLPFQRLHQSKDYPGTGIGLAIVQRIIKHHQGTIWAESQVGKGATFYFTLPERVAELGEEQPAVKVAPTTS